MNFFKAFRVMGVVMGFFEKAMSDGKVDAAEAGQLVKDVADCLGVKAHVEMNMDMDHPDTSHHLNFPHS